MCLNWGQNFNFQDLHITPDFKLTTFGRSLIVQKPLCFVTLSGGSSVERCPLKDACPFFVRVNSRLDFPPITSSEMQVQLSKALFSLKSHTNSSRSTNVEVRFVDHLAAKDGLKILAMLFPSRQIPEGKRSVRGVELG